jgi:NADH dehydrogenase
MWLTVHLIFLVGFRNRIAVLLNWAYAYYGYKRGARIIASELPGAEPAQEVWER